MITPHARPGRSYKILLGKPEQQGKFGRNINRWENNIKINRKEVGWEHAN